VVIIVSVSHANRCVCGSVHIVILERMQWC